MISNPYAKKKPTTNSAVAAAPRPVPHQSTQQTRTTRGPQTAAAAEAPLPRQAATTFSQAFESIEDSDVYQNQLQHRQLHTNDDGAFCNRAEQRAFETVTAETTQHPPQQPQQPQQIPQMSERDSHVLMQQPHVLYVSVKQRGNGCLQYIRNVPVCYQKMVPDYVFSNTSCALFLSIKYHNLFPDYIFKRIAALRNDFAIRILLLLVDAEDCASVLLQLNKTCVTHNFTLILAWTEEEAARYLETFKAVDGKDAGSIQKSKDSLNFADQVTDVLTTCKGLNKTDAGTVLTQFGSVRAAMAATPDELGLIPGLGEVKVKRLYDAFHKPFSSKVARERKEEQKRVQAEQELANDANEKEFED